MQLEARVYGDPRPQGSKRGFVSKTGKVAMVESSGEALKTWRNRVASMVAASRPPDGLLDIPVALSVTFFLRRPKKPRYATAPAGRPDLSKLVRGIEDELTGVWVRDDSLIVSVYARKCWERPNEPPGAEIRVGEAGDL